MTHLLRFGLSAAAFTLALALFPVASFAASANVTMTGNSFGPSNVTVNAGDTVTWSNSSSAAHTVTSDTSLFDSGSIGAGAQYALKFNTPGTYRYYCKFHGGVGGAGMSGTITVVAANAPTNISTNSSASASTNDNAQQDALRAQAQALLNQVTQMQQQLGAGAGGAVGSSGPVNSSACPNIGRTLKVGVSGDDVTRLQQYLAQDPSLYPEGTVSGYFGALTQSAVQRWQAEFNIVSSGSAATTGFGVVGPRTAAAIALLCSTSGAATGGGTSGGDTVGGFIQISPVSGNAPLAVNVVATVNTPKSCGGTIYTLNFGDGSNTVQIPVSAGSCQQLSQTFPHVYQSGGTFQVTLSAGTHETSAAVTVYGTSAVANPTPPSTGTFSADKSGGKSPLSVIFTGNAGFACNSTYGVVLDYGDGSTDANISPCNQFTRSHTYSAANNYQASLLVRQSAGTGLQLLGNPMYISVTAPVVYAYHPPSPDISVGGNPLKIALNFDISPCPAYSIDWGDGSPISGLSSSECPASQSGSGSSKSVEHTYPRAGSYTIHLSRGSSPIRTDDVSIAIIN